MSLPTHHAQEELESTKNVQQEHTEILGEHTKILGQHTKTLKEHSKVLGAHSEKLDSITAELHQVHQLADTTLDIVKARYEKNEQALASQ